MMQFPDDPCKYILIVSLVETSTSSYHLYLSACVHQIFDNSQYLNCHCFKNQFWKIQTFNNKVVVSKRLKSLCSILHDVTREYAILTG